MGFNIYSDVLLINCKLYCGGKLVKLIAVHYLGLMVCVELASRYYINRMGCLNILHHQVGVSIYPVQMDHKYYKCPAVFCILTLPSLISASQFVNQTIDLDFILFLHIQLKIVCLLWFYVPGTPKLISGWVPTCDSAHSW